MAPTKSPELLKRTTFASGALHKRSRSDIAFWVQAEIQSEGQCARGQSVSTASETPATVELVERAIRGDEVATTVVLSITYPRLRQHLQRRIPRDIQGFVDVDDVVQDT